MLPSVALNKTSVSSGAPIEITYSFTAKSNFSPRFNDLTIFVHFIDQKDRKWFQDDHKPPKPFQQWSGGEKQSWTHTIFIPRNVPPGKYKIVVGVYSPSNKDRIPLEGDEYTRNSYLVGNLDILAYQQPKIEYVTGWYPPETDPNDFTQTWRWTGREATVKTRNPGNSSNLYLKLEGVPQAYGIDQKLTITVQGHQVDSFSTVTSQPILKKYLLDKNILGSDENVLITLTASHSFIPASRGLSKDTRELGVLVHNFYLDNAGK